MKNVKISVNFILINKQLNPLIINFIGGFFFVQSWNNNYNNNMRFKNILLKELFKRKYRNRIKQSKKGKGSFKRFKKIKVED